jgi:hypothetical protein
LSTVIKPARAELVFLANKLAKQFRRFRIGRACAFSSAVETPKACVTTSLPMRMRGAINADERFRQLRFDARRGGGHQGR